MILRRMKVLASSRRSKITEFPVLTLNIGGRNTNPLEFVLEGDESAIGQQVTTEWIEKS